MKANTNTNNNSDKRHYKSYIHPRTSLPLLAVGCFALMGHSVHAATTFTGSVDNTWEDAGNWDAGLPDAADDVFFDTAATLTSTSTIRRLLLDGAGDILTINAGGDLTGAASKGFINASAQLIVNSGGSYTRAGTLDILANKIDSSSCFFCKAPLIISNEHRYISTTFLYLVHNKGTR